MTNLDEYQSLILASLLHDIGKFWQRAEENVDDTRLCQNLPKHRKFSQCKECQKEFGYQHAVLAQAFFEDYIHPQWQKYGSSALYHHAPKDRLTKIVALADRLSSMEREREEDEPTEEQLFSIFCRIEGEKGTCPKKYLGLNWLRFEKEVLFPSEVPLKSTKEAYQELWKAFINELSLFNKVNYTSSSDGFDAYVSNIYSLLQKYTWTIPGAHYETIPDISLFDHLRTTCAIATSLFKSNISEIELNSILAQIKTKKGEIEEVFDPLLFNKPFFSLIGGDISRVQSFLYTLTSQGVAKGLKGRSFYLQLITEIVARWLLKSLELPLANLIYAGGGHFYILAYYLGQQIEKYKAELSQTFLKHHQGDLYLALTEVPLSIADFKPDILARKWQQVSQNLATAKYRYFSELSINELNEQLFQPQGEAISPICAICHREGASYPIPDDPFGRQKCPLCYSFEELGSSLRDSKYMLFAFQKQPSVISSGWQALFNTLGVKVELAESLSQIKNKLQKDQSATLFIINDTNLKETLKLLPDYPSLSLGFYFLANVTPRKNGEIADFEEMAEISQGVPRLGILRMDVDNLGDLFQKGLGNSATFSRIASLSFNLRLFFEGWLNQICQNENLHNQIYTIYSGGDDLFITGSWSVIPLLAKRIREDFREFVCQNPNITISAGIAIEKAKFPLYQFARTAKEALDDRAKARIENGRIVKDAIDFLGHTFSWEDFGEVEEWQKKLISWIEPTGKAPRALLQLLMSLFVNYKQELEKVKGVKPSQLFYGRWIWLSNYYLCRLSKRIENSPEIKQGILDLADEILNKPDFLKKIAIASRWAELLTRKLEQE